MSTYLLTWNPRESNVSEIDEVWKKQCAGRPAVPADWSCGSNKSISVNARVFLHRQRDEPRGIVASGWVVKGTYQRHHWNADRRKRGDKANFVDWVPDAAVPGFGDLPDHPPLQAHLTPDGPVCDDITWNNMPGSGISVSEAAAAELEKMWARHIGGQVSGVPQGEELSAIENWKTRKLMLSRFREVALRKAKIRQALKRSPDGRLRCEVPGCGFCFEDVYGALGAGYAHVHHLTALASGDEPVRTTLDDLAVVCANCHAMIHRNGECRPLDGLAIRRRT
jgi:5-methylcytosine-specific restriction enzyme A